MFKPGDKVRCIGQTNSSWSEEISIGTLYTVKSLYANDAFFAKEAESTKFG
jgi:hypothetical protein